jgi:hypothetical protein
MQVTNQTIKDINKRIVEEVIEWFVLIGDNRASRDEVIAKVALLVECVDDGIDACSHCGAMPMTTNCNNAGCDK